MQIPLFVRLAHWIIAVVIVLNLFVLEEGDDWHRWLGYTAVAVLFFRLGWSYLKRYRRSAPSLLATLNHVFIWICLFCLGLSGWLMMTDRFWGDETLESIHSTLATTMQVLIAMHFIGLALDSIRFKRHSWTAMFTGKVATSSRAKD